MSSAGMFQSSSEEYEKKITLDFGQIRRTSFLPPSFVDSYEEVHKPMKVVEASEDNLFMFLTTNEHSDCHQKPMKQFCTGSKYVGQWNKLGIAGKGIYKFPHGVIYDGYFNRNGEFHGRGILVYPNGERIEGTWKNGKLGDDNNFITKAGVLMNKSYCLMPDRRFQIELENDFNPVGHEFLTNEEPPPRKIPEASYDLVEGFFDSRVKIVYAHAKPRSFSKQEPRKRSSLDIMFNVDSKTHQVRKTTSSETCQLTLMKHSEVKMQREILWIPSSIQEAWIVKNCSKAWDEAVGYRPDLYEEWTKGGSTTYVDLCEKFTEHDSIHEIIQLLAKQATRNQRTNSSFIRRKTEPDIEATFKILAENLISSISKTNWDSIFIKKYEMQNKNDIY